MAVDQVNLGVAITTNLDKASATRAERDLTALVRKLSDVEIEWGKIAKATNISVKEIKDVSTAASDFGRKLSAATRSSIDRMKELGDALGDAQKEAATLEKVAKKAKGTAAEKAAEEWMAAVKRVHAASKDIEDFRKTNRKAREELEKVAKSHKDYAKSLQDAAKFDRRQFASEMGKQGGVALRGFVSKDLKGVISGIGGMGVGVGQAAKGALAKRAMAAGAGTAAGGIGGASGALLKLAPVISGLATSLGIFVALLAAASDHQSKLNKAIVSGTGTVNDFFTSGAKYANVINNMRQAAITAHGSMLEFGADSEKMLNVVNAFAQTSTGSLTKTSQFLSGMGNDLADGMKKFTTSAIAYGKALGIEAEEVAKMMGNFQSEVGYSAEQSMKLMTGVVKSASMANMPVTKFMDIFKSVTPHVELFTNRIETLTAALTLLGKTMSPDQVKKFMEAFGGSLAEESFRARLKKTLVAGVGVTSQILKKDFSGKAKTFEAQMDKISPELGKQFATAWKSGNKQEFNKVLAEAEAAGVSPAQIGAMQRTFGYERARQRGGALETATAVKGAGMLGQVKIAEAMMRRLGQLKEGEGITGISEQVAESLGMSQKQVNAINDLIASVGFYATKIDEYGTTGSKATDKALAEIAAEKGLLEKGTNLQDLTRADMMGLRKEAKKQGVDFRDMLFEATERAAADKKTAWTAEKLAREQYNATASISEKLTNVIAFLLEKLYNVMQPLLDVLNDLWAGLASWLSGDKEAAKTSAQISKFQENIEKNYGGQVAAQTGIFADAIKKAAGDPKQMALAFAKEAKSAGAEERLGPIFEKLMHARMDKTDFEATSRSVYDKMYTKYEKTEGRLSMAEMWKKHEAEMLEAWAKETGTDVDWGNILMEMGQTVAAQGAISEEAKSRVKERKQFKREKGREELERAKGEEAIAREDKVIDLKRREANIFEEGEAPKTPAQAKKKTIEEAKAKTKAETKEKKAQPPTKADVKGHGISPEMLAYYNNMVAGYHAGKMKMPGGVRTGKTVVDDEFRERLKKVLVAKNLSTAFAMKGDPEAQKALKASMVARLGGGPGASAATNKAIEEQLGFVAEEGKEGTKAIVKTEEQRAERLEKATNEVYDGVDDVLSLLKKGIKLEDNFIQGRYRKVLKEATLESFRTALLEFAILQNKIAQTPALQQTLLEEGWKAMGAYSGDPELFKKLTEEKGQDPKAYVKKFTEGLGLERQAGGAITETGMHLLHAGEYVMSAAQAANMRAAGMSPTGRGGDTFNIYVNAQTDASPEQIASVVRYEMIRTKEKS